MSLRTGHCLCGAVRITGRLPETGFEACHCTQCQRWTGGGPYFAIRIDDLTVEGAESVAVYHASELAERAHCARCGSPLWWRMQGRPVRTVALGLLDDQSDLHLSDEIFVDHRPAWLPATPGATQATEAEKIAELQAFLEARP